MSRALLVLSLFGVVTLAGCGSALPREPTVYRARLMTSKGPFVIEVHRDWAPFAADRFRELIVADHVWQVKNLPDEQPRTSNRRGTVALTGSAAPNSRTTHAFINLADDLFLDEGSASWTTSSM